MKNPIEKSLLQYSIILASLYQIYQSVFDVVVAAPLNSILINIILTTYFLLLLLLLRLNKAVNLVAALYHISLLPVFFYFWYYNGGMGGLVPLILCMYIGLIIATTHGLVTWISIGLYAFMLVILLFFPFIFTPVNLPPLNLGSKPVDYFIVALLITFFTIYLKNKYLYYRNQVVVRNEQLSRVATTLVHQNEELRTQQEEIRSINDNLESLIAEHTLGIETKNKELAEYAFINAHMLRGPLSRILGLTNLMETDPGTYNSAEIQQIKRLALEIDKVVRKINETLN